MKVKTATLTGFKALDDDAGGEPTGTFEAIVSVFGNVDYAGDRVVAGAFAKSLESWKASGDPIPVVWSHQWQDPDMHIGGVLEAEERDEGLWVKGQLDVEDNPTAATVWRLLSKRRVREFSFAYDVIDEQRTKDANELRELDVFEVGPTLKGMNPDTVLLDAKALRDARAARAAAKADSETDSEGSDDTHVPPQKVQDNAQRALDAIENGEAGEGFTDTGRSRAEQLAAGEAVPLAEVREISAWFARHEADEGRDEENTPAWVAWMAWGGDEGREWADGIVEQADQDDDGNDADDSSGSSSTGTSSRPGGRKARVTLDGSVEQLQERLRSAITDWAFAAWPRDLFIVGLEATWPDQGKAVVYTEMWADPWGGGGYHEASYTVGDDGAISLGDPVEVELIGVVEPKSLPAAAQAKKDLATTTPPAASGGSPQSLLATLAVVDIDD